MPLSWNEITDRALKFSREWANKASEDAEAKSFWDGFFEVFGIPRRLGVRTGDNAGEESYPLRNGDIGAVIGVSGRVGDLR